MNSGKRWSLGDVDEETREALLKAAQQSGLSINEWLGQPANKDDPESAEAAGRAERDEDDDEGGRALANAIAHLTARLNTMDEEARESVAGLKGRLAEIEHGLGHVAETRQTGREKKRSLKNITAMVDALVHELDNVDERARSMVEGLRGRPAAAEPSQPRINRVAEAIRDLDLRVAAMGSRRAPPPAAADERPQKLDDIRHRLDALLAEAPPPAKEPPPRVATIEATLRALEARIDEAKARLTSAREPQPSAQSSGAADQIRRVEARLDEISGRLPQRKDADLAAAIREISAHQRTIDDRAETLAIRREQKAFSTAMAALHADIVALSQQVAAMGRGSGEDQVAVFDLARRIDALAADRPLDHKLLGDIRADLDALRASVEDSSDHSAIANLQESYGEIAGRLDAFLRNAPDRARLDALGEEVSALRRALEADGSPTAISRLEMRFAELSRSVETAVSARHPAAAGPDIGRLEGRLDEIASSIHDLLDRSASETASPTVHALERRLTEMGANINGLLSRPADVSRQAGEAAGPDVGRIESRIDEIAATIDGLVDRTAPVAEIKGLQERLQGLAERIERLVIPNADRETDLDEIKAEVASIRAVHERLQTLTERIDAMSATQHQPLLAIAEIKDGLSSIRTVQERLHTLTDRLDRLSAVQRDPVPALDQMKTSIATMRAVHERMQALTERIDGLGITREPTEVLNEMKSGIAALQTIHERLHTLTERIDNMAAQRQPALALDEIKTEITAIRSEMAGRSSPSSESLEAQIRDLAARLDTVSRPEAESRALAELETQVAQIAGELESAKPRVAALQQVEERIDRLQAHLSDNREESLEAARAEAREAVRDLSAVVAGSPADSDLISALMQELASLRGATGEVDQRTRTKLEAVNQSLAQVVARLSRLEEEAAQPARATGTYGAGSTASAWTTALRADEADDQDLADRDDPAGEPAEFESSDAGSDAHQQRADFISAARRAAQAAAEETAAAEIEQTGGEAKRRLPGAFSRISQAIRDRKRSLFLAASAIVLSAGAIQIYSSVPASDNDDVLIATASVDRDTATTHRDVVAEATATPTVPQVTAPALVAPLATADREVAFAAPALGDHFGSAPAAPDTDRFDTGEQDVADSSAQELPATPASTGAGQTPDASVWPLADARIGSPTLINAAASGDPAAAFEVATRYAEGKQVAKNLAKAVEWYERAAQGGIAVAQYRLGSLYERGQGAPRDLTKAVNWYQRAADQGNVNAMHNLAVLMSEGTDDPPDQAKALQWFLAAADYGIRDSQYNLGVIYARGLGPGQDLVESYKWFAIAAAQGDADGAARRDEVAEALSPDDLAKARAAVEAWRVKPSLTEANGFKAPDSAWDDTGDSVSEADRQALVTKIQTLLAEQGFDPGPADGLVGPKTRQAVLAYQRKAGAPETGQIDNNLVAALSESSH